MISSLNTFFVRPITLRKVYNRNNKSKKTVQRPATSPQARKTAGRGGRVVGAINAAYTDKERRKIMERERHVPHFL